MEPMNVTLYGKRDLAGMIKLRILTWGNYSGSSGWALNIITDLFMRGRQRAIGKKLTTEPKGYVRTEASCYAAGFEDGERVNSKRM